MTHPSRLSRTQLVQQPTSTSLVCIALFAGEVSWTMGCLGTKTVGWLFLVLLLSSEAIELNRRVNIAKFPSLLFHGDAKAHIDRLVADFEGGFGAPDGEGSDDELTPKQIIDIQNSLRESLSFEGSPVLFELDTMTPAKLEAPASDTAKYKHEISDILRKSTEPLNQLISLLETVTASKKTTARHSWGRATSVLQQATAGENVAQGDCERTTALTCGRNEECVSSKNNPCKGFCQCNIDGVSNCECVKEVTFSGPFAASLDDEKNIDQAFTFNGAAVEGVYGLLDGFLGGSISDMRTPWNKNAHCLQLRDDFSGGMRDIIHTVKVLLHTVRRESSHVLFERAARKRLKESVKTALGSFVEFFKTVTPGMWECPATRLVIVTVGVIAAAIRVNMIAFALLGAVVPIMIKWVGAIIGLYFSFQYLRGAFRNLQTNLRLKRSRKCDLECKKKITFNSFAIVGCLLEVVLMGAVSNLFNVKKLRINRHVRHDILVLKNAAAAAKNGKAAGKIGPFVQKFWMKRPPKILFNKAKVRRATSHVNARTFQRGGKTLSGKFNRNIKAKGEADLQSMYKTTINSCDKKEWYKIYAAHKGKCEDKSQPGACADGVFIRGYCSGHPKQVKCCIRTGCFDGKGKCTTGRNCGTGYKILSGHCPGPAYVKCCVPEDDENKN